jgi:hypothetical protein
LHFLEQQHHVTQEPFPESNHSISEVLTVFKKKVLTKYKKKKAIKKVRIK